MSEYALIGTNSQNLLVRDEQLLRLSEVPSIGTTVPHGRSNSLLELVDSHLYIFFLFCLLYGYTPIIQQKEKLRRRKSKEN